MRLAVLPPTAVALSASAAVIFGIRSTGAHPGPTLWAVLAGATAVAAAAVLIAAVAADRAARLVSDRVGALRRSAARGEADLRALVEALRRGETPPRRGPRKAPPEDADDLDLLAAELARAHDGAVTAVVQAAQLSSQAGSEQKLEVFVNLARRLQSLVHREISILDDLENEIEDPDLLKGLFHVDHLATRIRRHAENLAVLGGAVSRRQWSNPVSMTEVLRSAIAEVEQYSRVKLVPPVDGELRGHAVADVIHLLAELVENATVFSAPHTQVLLRAGLVTSGLAVEVEDRGLGMPVGEQARMNALLADPDQVNVASLLADGRIGLYVVSQLARRHGITVRLQTNIYGGVQAVLVVPQAVLGSAPGGSGGVPGRQTGAADTGPLPVPPPPPASGGTALPAPAGPVLAAPHGVAAGSPGTTPGARGPAAAEDGTRTAAQAGTGQGGIGQAGPRQVASARPEPGQAGFGQAGTGQTGFGQPGTGQPGTGQAGPGQPGTGQLGTGQPATGQAGTSQAGLGQPGTGQAGTSQAGLGQPGTGQPGTSQPGTGQAGPGQPVPTGRRRHAQRGSARGAAADGSARTAADGHARSGGEDRGAPPRLPVRGAHEQRSNPAEAVPGIGADDRPAVEAHAGILPTPRTGAVRGTMDKPRLPRRRAQEHIVPQLRGGPAPRQEGDTVPGHDPGLMAAFQRGIGLAEAQQGGQPGTVPADGRHRHPDRRDPATRDPATHDPATHDPTTRDPDAGLLEPAPSLGTPQPRTHAHAPATEGTGRTDGSAPAG
ncbi:ATP-binding protein [Streptomyces collinus]|uniref:ATP-binding protein n=1 Tax=Streptomyces collinus TaxID=42684 RepID=UPI0036E4C6FC